MAIPSKAVRSAAAGYKPISRGLSSVSSWSQNQAMFGGAVPRKPNRQKYLPFGPRFCLHLMARLRSAKFMCRAVI